MQRLDGGFRRITVERPSEAKHHKQLHGLTRTLVANMVTRRDRRATASRSRSPASATAPSRSGDKLQLNLGYSHPIEIDAAGRHQLRARERRLKLAVVGIDKELVGQIAAQVRATRKPEPYKGKGVHYLGERSAARPARPARSAARSEPDVTKGSAR